MAQMTYSEACRAIINARGNEAVNWAVNYAKAGLAYAENSDAARVQSLYILNNITSWRGDVAKEARAALKRTAGIK